MKISSVTSAASLLAATLLPLAARAEIPLIDDLVKQESWSYVPNENFADCIGADPNSWGCCGAADEGKSQRCGPNNWIHINESTTVNCANTPGNQQSPINFQTMGDTAAKLVPISKEQGAMTFSGHKCEGEVEFKEGTWEVVVPDDCGFKVTVNGTTYKMAQFHFHNAEHSINYAYMPLEIHMVHISEDDPQQYLVLATFMAPGSQNPFFRDLEQQDYADPTKPKVLTNNKINAYDVLPKDLSYWHYEGSLTTPPCQTKTGGKVLWYVFQNPATISLPQLFFFTSYFEDLPLANNGRISRDIQPVLEATTIYSYP